MASIVDRRPVDDIYATRKQKEGKPYLKGMMDYWIGKLMYEKRHIPICRRYYSGRREESEFDYLTDNYGIGNPVDLGFTPIIKPRIDALVGLFLSETFSYAITVTDDKTLHLEEEAKKNYTISQISNIFKQQVGKIQEHYNKAQRGYQAPLPEEKQKEEIDKIMGYLNDDFVSVYAEAANHLVQFFEQDSATDIKRKVAELLYDLLITGEMNWRIDIKEKGRDPQLEVIKPENIFFNKNKNDMYMDSVNAVVHREFMTRHTVLQRFGDLLSKEDKDKIFGIKPSAYGTSRRIADPQRMEDPYHQQNDNTLSNQFTNNEFDTVEVLHVEWLASNEVGKKKSDGSTAYIEDRYEGYRIGFDIYFGMKKSDTIIRSQVDPYKATLTYSGMSYNQRQGEPYSMVWNLKDVQDMYDITQFHRNNLVATAGVSGTRVNIAGIPKILGSSFMERLMKWVALRKQGMELIDPTEEGAQLFNHYGEFQGGIDGNAINGINSILQTLERQVVLTTGITDQMLGQIEEREAVENVKTGIRQVSLITLNIFDLLGGAKKRILKDMIDNAKVSYTKGKVGSYKVGPSSIAFKIDKSDFSWTDYNIQVTTSSRDALKLQKLEGLVSELVSAGMVKPEVAINLVLADTLLEAKKIVKQGMGGEDQQGQQMQEMDGQLKQYEEQLKQATQQAEKLQRESDKNMATQLGLDQERLKLDQEVRKREVAVKEKAQITNETTATEDVKAKREIVQLEREQLYIEGANEQAREINNSKI